MGYGSQGGGKGREQAGGRSFIGIYTAYRLRYDVLCPPPCVRHLVFRRTRGEIESDPARLNGANHVMSTPIQQINGPAPSLALSTYATILSGASFFLIDGFRSGGRREVAGGQETQPGGDRDQCRRRYDYRRRRFGRKAGGRAQARVPSDGRWFDHDHGVGNRATRGTSRRATSSRSSCGGVFDGVLNAEAIRFLFRQGDGLGSREAGHGGDDFGTGGGGGGSSSGSVRELRDV